MGSTPLSTWRSRAATIVAGLTLEEKASLCSGADFWNTKSIDHAGIAAFMLTDGPHGLRKQASDADHLGLNESVPATAFPSGAGLAASWDRALIHEVGKALGGESRAERVGVLLGPAVNIKRHPLGGRNFEYLSEDPLLTGELAAAYIDGVQSVGVGTSLKHFAVNNQEKNRLLVDVVVDPRTLREVYLRAFEIAVTRAQPWTVMSAYNKVNGTYASDNSWLLRDVLREEWGHEGIVVSDWGAEDDRVAGIRAGMGLEMPGNGGIGDREIVDAVQSGALTEETLDDEVIRIVALHLAVQANRGRAADTVDLDAHHDLARRAASAATVLLKNDGGLLPIPPRTKLAVLGAFAETPRYQGGGSSHIHATRIDSLLSALETEHTDIAVAYAAGYRVGDPMPDPDLLAAAERTAADADVVVVLVGLTDQEESEGYDRAHMRISPSHLALVEVALRANEHVVVALSNGAPVEMPFAERVPAILECYLGGQASGSSLADVLTGVTEPSGRLAETFPIRLEDSPAYLNFPGTRQRVEYREGVFVGYRHYDTVRREPLFPFGHGLGYSDPVIIDTALDRAEVSENETVTVQVTVLNAGARRGSQVVQVYVHQEGAQPFRPEQELVAFDRIALEPGQRGTLSFVLDRRAFAYWGAGADDWVVDDARFAIRVGTSSRAIAEEHLITVHGSGDVIPSAGHNTALGELLDHPVLGGWARRLRATFIAGQSDYDPASPEALLVDAFSRELPLRSLLRIAGLITQDELARAVRVLDGSADAVDVAAFESEEVSA